MGASSPHKTKAGSYQIKVRTTDGKGHCRGFPSFDAAQAYRDELMSNVVPPSMPAKLTEDVAPYDGTVTWWSDLLGKIAYRIVTCENVKERDELRRDLNIFARAGQSVKSLIDAGTLETRMAAIEKKQREIRTRKQHGAGSRGAVRVQGEN